MEKRKQIKQEAMKMGEKAPVRKFILVNTLLHERKLQQHLFSSGRMSDEQRMPKLQC